MDANTLEKLAKNPHYKMSEQQRLEYEALKSPPVQSFGKIKYHPQNLDTHPTQTARFAITNPIQKRQYKKRKKAK